MAAACPTAENTGVALALTARSIVKPSSLFELSVQRSVTTRLELEPDKFVGALICVLAEETTITVGAVDVALPLSVTVRIVVNVPGAL